MFKSVVALYGLLGLPLIAQYYDIKKFFDKEVLRDAMDVLYRGGVPLKLYQLWFKLNQRTKISLKIALGVTNSEEVGEVLGQGSSGGAVVSAVNLDDGVRRFFEGSGDELSYGSVALKPLIFQDDIARLCVSQQSAQAGNNKLNQMTKLKQLECHPDKTGFILLGQKNNVEKIRREISKNPLFFGDFKTKEKEKEKWLGEISHQDGLSKSVEATIHERSGKIKAAIFETKSIVDDYRMQSIGGLLGAFDIWEMAICPSLLTNFEMWVEMSEEASKALDDIKKLFLQVILETPGSTPRPSFSWETGTLELKF